MLLLPSFFTILVLRKGCDRGRDTKELQGSL